MPLLELSRMFSIDHGKSALVLAPMEGVTDAPMRTLLSERGGLTHCVSEFFRVSENVPSKRALLKHMPELKNGGVTASGVSVQMQLLGGHAERLALTAKLAVESGSPGIDLNFGCPAPIVNRNDGGAALLKYPARIKEIVSAVREAVPKSAPVSVKLRLGFESMEDIYTNAVMAEAGGATWLTIHARTKTQGYRPPAYWEYIAETKKRVSIPVVANGDIWDLEGFKRCRDITGCEHFMVGRGVLVNPSLPHQIARELGLPATPLQETGDWKEPRDWEKIFERFSRLCDPHAENPHYNLCRLKQWLNLVSYRQELPWFKALKRTQFLGEFFSFLSANPGA